MTHRLLDSIQEYLPSNWRDYSLETHCFPLNVHDAEFATVKTKFCSTFPGVTPQKIERVESTQLYGMYLLKKAEYGTDTLREMSLWHATSEYNAKLILESNLDWRLAKRVKFGQGVSFSPSAAYANRECNRSTPSERVSILCKVLVERTAVGTSGTVLPPNGIDTTVGNGSNVYVKYCDNEFYPEYVVYYHPRL